MHKIHHGLTLRSVLFCGFLTCSTSIFAATPVDLSHQPLSIIHSFLVNDKSNNPQVKQLSSAVDFNQTQHVRLQQMYSNYPVWGGDFVLHAPKGNIQSINDIATFANSTDISMNGTIYNGIEKDLNATPAYALTTEQMDKAMQQAILSYQKKNGIASNPITEKTSSRIIYIDKNNKAHWAYLISFVASPANAIPQKPTFIMDATTLEIYKEWDNIQTLSNTFGGGFGGNEKISKFVYDGLQNNFPKLDIQRDDTTNFCFLKNSDVTVKNASNGGTVISYECKATDNSHDQVYWNADHDAVNGAYSPSNDALFVGKIVKNMYQEWYGVPVLKESNGSPMMLNMQVHLRMDNAYWNGREMFFGDGIRIFYPLVSIGVAAHEISHGFTQQHSNLEYYGQSGGLNESFSDMAAQAAEFYATKKNHWTIGDEIYKEANKALRYMDEPTKDCGSKKPGSSCSISNVEDYDDYIDVHYSSGIFNKFFYLLGTSKKWDTQKAFNVMVHANQNYWTSESNFTQAACGVIKSAKDYKYPVKAVKQAAKGVGIDVSKC